MSSILYTIDAFLDTKQKYDVTIELIEQLRRLDPNRKILLINKNNNSFGIEKYVDYYEEFLDGFLVKSPPQHIIDNNEYEQPYVFFAGDFGTLENWLPTEGLNDHVANIYNGFVFAAKQSQLKGYDKVFRIEYDMLFDDEEFKTILNDINQLEHSDYLFYGRREGSGGGQWAKEYQTAIDLHFCGFSNKLLYNFDFVKNEIEYWDLCKKIKYVGKWSEYVISMVFESAGFKNFDGKVFVGHSREKFNKSKFDRISSTSIFDNRWRDIPKICKVSGYEDKIGIFYVNQNYESVEIETISNKDYYKKITLGLNHWLFDIIDRHPNMIFMSKMTYDDISKTSTTLVNDDTYPKLSCRLILKN